jgi:nitrite reductase/ring-hydroxylating ferredoxin subunit
MFRKETRWIKMSFSADELELNRTDIRYVAGKKVCFTRTTGGVFAFEDKCPHNGFSLSLGKISADGLAIVCPLHRYQYNMKTGRCSHSSGGAAFVFPVESREDGLYVGVEETRWGWK